MRCNATNETEAMSTAIQKISHQYPDLEWLVAPTRAGYALPLDRSLDDAIIRDVG